LAEVEIVAEGGPDDHGNLKYKAEYCDMLVTHMKKGMSFSTFGVDIGVARSTLYEWKKNHPEFEVAAEKGFDAGLKFFESLLISSSMGVLPPSLQKLNSRGISLSAVIFALKTRFHKDYSEVQTVDHTSSDGSMKVHFIKPEEQEEKVKEISES